MSKHIIEITWEPELLGGQYIAGVDGRKYPDAPYPGFGKTKAEAVGNFVMGNPVYLGIDVADISGYPSREDGDWDEIVYSPGEIIYKLNGKVIGKECRGQSDD